MKKQKIALFHPWLKSKGGAEKVVLGILKSKKYNIDIYTWVYDKENTFKEFQKFKINVIGPKISKKLSRLHILRGLFLPISIFSKIPLEKYDKFLISTSGVGEFITFKNYKKGKTYAYIHTPLREASDEIVEWNLKNRHNNFLKKQIYLTAVKIYKIFEKKAWKKLDVIIFNSELSKSRAEEHKLIRKQKTHIIYPPINFPQFERLKTRIGKHFVYISRLNPPKRQDLLIEAWKKFSKKNKGYKLILIGTPDNKNYYKKLLMLSKDDNSIEIKSNVKNKELGDLLRSSKAGIFLGYQEDFGIVPLEILAAGKPLLAIDEGGYVNVIKNHPLFHKIKEKHSRKEMVNEIVKELENFVKKKQKKTTKQIKIKDFVTEIDKILNS